MGDWITLHLFDENSFTGKTIPILKGDSKNTLKTYYKEYLKYNEIGGIVRFSETQLSEKIDNDTEKIIERSSYLSYDFKKHTGISDLSNFVELDIYIRSNDFHYDFVHVFTFLVFQTCSDFSPHIGLGKHGIRNSFDFKWNSVARNILNQLDVGNYNSFFAHDGRGIISWIGNEATELLFLDCEQFKNSEHENERDFYCLVKTAVENRLGLMTAVNLFEDRLGDIRKMKLIPKKY